MIRIAVVEDNASDAQTICEYCNRYAEENGKEFSVNVFNNGFNFVSLGQFDFDIILLDVKMPYMNGLETAKKIRESNEHVVIVFITSMQQYAIYGYSVDATDFIVKPVKYQVFRLKFDRILSVAERMRGRIVAIKTGKDVKYLNVGDIFYIESQKHKLIYHTVTGNHETWGTMKETEALFSSYGFALCNSGLLVNMRYVEQISGDNVVLKGFSLPISRPKKKSFSAALAQYYNSSLMTGRREEE